MLYWNRQPLILYKILTYLNIVFIIIFAFEAIAKITAFGLEYFDSGWNILDLLVIVLGIIGAALDYFMTFNLGSSSSIIRTFRIGRLIRLIKKAKSLNMIFNTLILTLPSPCWESQQVRIGMEFYQIQLPIKDQILFASRLTTIMILPNMV